MASGRREAHIGKNIQEDGMSVHVSERKKSNMDVQVKADELIKYTLEITANEKTFHPKFHILTDKMVDLAFDIGVNLWEANKVYVRKDTPNYEANRKLRRMLQDTAIRDCSVFHYYITLAKRVFHLTTKRTVFWTQLVETVRTLAIAWRDSDTRRYRNDKEIPKAA